VGVPKNLSWLFFDLDGTLADSVEAIYQAYLTFMLSLGLKGSEEEFAALNGPSLREIVTILRRRHGLGEGASGLLDSFRECVKEAYRERVKPMPGAEAVLAELRKRGYGLVLVTSGAKTVADVFLKRYDWERYFCACVFGDEVRRTKPHGDIYIRALEKVEAKADQVVVVEDSLNGVRAAQAAGLEVVLLQNDKPPDQDVRVAATISRLDEILEIL
jgi:HAD superfamily hydrolase (TIGR01509 family)